MGATAYSLMALRKTADDAEWMSGKSRARLAPVFTEASSWMSDLSAQEALRKAGVTEERVAQKIEAGIKSRPRGTSASGSRRSRPSCTCRPRATRRSHVVDPKSILPRLSFLAVLRVRAIADQLAIDSLG